MFPPGLSGADTLSLVGLIITQRIMESMFRSIPSRFAVSLVVCATLAGCKHSTEDMGSHTRQFEIKGTVIASDKDRNEVTLQHEAIPGFMEAMTMPYSLLWAGTASELHPGDRIRARLLVEQTEDGDYRKAKLDEIAILAQAKPDYKPAKSYHVPTAGDDVPDFKVIDQSGHTLELSSYYGKSLLLTFIYTRCPLNDFCPKMSRNFAAIDKVLQADPNLYAHTALLSVSFDPAYDKPEVLKAYGANYTGGKGFEHWKFAAPVDDSLKPMEQFFNLGATPGDSSSITHSLSTVLIGPDGKIAAWYPGSEWSPEEVTAKMRSLVQAPKPPVAGKLH